MKRFITIALILFGVSITTHAADEEWPASSFQKTFSLEIGAGIMPATHFLMDMYERSMDKSLKENGQKLADPTSYPPTFSLSAIWHTGPRWEMVVTGVISWWNYALYQLDSFGIGPDGKPRYDFSSEGTFVNDNTCYGGSLAFQARHYWKKSTWYHGYSAYGLGVSTDGKTIQLMPVWVPIGGRAEWNHLYFYLEYTLGAIATSLHGGFGWRF